MKRHPFAGIILGVISLFLIFVFSRTELFSSLELKLLDYRYNFKTEIKINPNIAIIGIDDSSVKMLGRWPWPRKLHAALLKILSQYPPGSVGFDVLFTEPDKRNPENDKMLVHYANLLGNIVFAGYIDDKTIKEVRPIEELEKVSSTGFINAPPDMDGVVRKIPLITKTSGGFHPSLSLQMLCTYLNVKFSDIEINEGRYIKIPSIGEIPIDNNGCMLIDYSGDQHVFSETAFQQVLSWGDELEKIRIFENKIVFVGVTATGIGDTGNIPIKTSVPLVTVHANAINTILNKSFIHKMDSLSSFGILVLCIILSTLINILFRPVKAGLLTVFTVMLYVAVSVLLFQKNIWLDILSPGLGFLMPFLLITVYRYGWEEKERRWVKKVFSHYLSSEVINEILKDPSKLKLGGELKTATVLSLDLCNFSAYCEGKCPSDVVGMLNNCFDWMTEIILNNGGMLDKYIGDAIMAIFGAPIEKPLVLQAQQAVNAALEILEKWNLLPEGERCSLNIGIGINTGPMLIGNMGSRYIFNYTAIGDEVNIASRVQGLTRQYAANIIITDSVYNLVKDKFQADSLGEVTVKGRKAPIIIYKVNSTRNKS